MINAQTAGRTFLLTPDSAPNAGIRPMKSLLPGSAAIAGPKTCRVRPSATSAGKNWCDMGFTVEQECPQCGAPIELDETDRILLCPYCNVKNFLFAPNYFRFVLPHKAPGKDIIYAPYLRFKGNVYSCFGRSIEHRFVDITQVGVRIAGLPGSLGLRPQAMKLKFLTPETEGSFLRFSLKANKILADAARLSTSSSTDRIFHRAYIGETLSLIYLPLFADDGSLFDAVLNRRMSDLAPGMLEQSMNRNPNFRLKFLPTLCPQCGWNLKAERDSVILTCSNCDTAWEATEGRFSQVNLSVVQGEEGSGTAYLPFWRITAEAGGLEIRSFADFIRLTNQPRIINRELEDLPMNFWAPAFKIRPKLFLKLSRQFTISQKRFPFEGMIPKGNIHPVTLPRSEAIQGMKLTLAGSTLNRKKIFPVLPQINFKIKDTGLVYLPFTEGPHDMVQQEMGISINRNTLEFGRKL